MSAEEQQKFLKQIDQNKDALIQRLATAVAIASVSGDASYRPKVHEMGDWLLAELKKLGATADLYPLGKQNLDGQEVDLPPVILGNYGEDPKKRTILIYGHYDVQPALKSDGWNTEPFELIHDEKTGRLYGRGSTDDKGPLLGWLNVIEAHKQIGADIPVNIKFCFEGMEESGSIGLDNLIIKHKDSFFKGVDAVCISDNYWLGTKKPCLTHGLRGLAAFKLSVSGPARDLHSGLFGGVVHEPMTDLVQIFSKLVSPSGEILVPGIMEQVSKLTEEESKRYDVMDFAISDIDNATGSTTTLSQDKAKVLMGRMRYPSLSLHGIEGAFAEPGFKTVIPAKVTGKFSIRLVPDMTPEAVEKAVVEYVNAEFKKLNSRNQIKIWLDSGAKPFYADPNHFNFVAASKATERIYNQTPDLIREGGSIPVAVTFSELLKTNTMLLPMGRADDGAHSTNEKLDLTNYIEGTKLLGIYLHEVAAAA
ncbi:hypothetical protein CF319_g3713 [Tilletia indica]|uniref:Peptidase M20 dimerisation domain-containing protein n=2 Tax=Tilletia TaxID=13289 RepID=A0A8X7N3K5_9BASI|nr:hypothetical protein CF319_g3713 [Tilletia indica]KAE8227890.1 hypothetical protein CF326_g7198 [Tilletia indica]KAE8259900.1 hypothetical protein A4X13_0g686 [Tilletia indica]KAE8265702.1 hypothetical protein A4X09_0g6549 [Tilletia walkeri]